MDPKKADKLTDEEFIEQLETGQIDSDDEPETKEIIESEEDASEARSADDADDSDEEENKEEEEETTTGSDEEVEDDQDEESEEETDIEDESEHSITENIKETAVSDKDSEDEDSTDDKEVKETFDYKKAYNEFMAPFKANGKTIELQNLEEARKLMQMGSNYTKKMQEMSQHRKVLAMLDKNGLLDESKVSYLIDLDKKNPDAIKKLFKEADIDPLDIDLDEESKYTPNKHVIDDKELALRSKLEFLKESSDGEQTIQTIYNDWDSKSKDALWDNPEILDVINNHRSKGFYDQIATEIDRQRTLGNIAPEVPFIQAYTQIGNAMTDAGLLKDSEASNTQPLKRKVVTRKKPTKDVNSAKLTKSSSRKVSKTINYDNLDDEEFLKEMKGRV